MIVVLHLIANALLLWLGYYWLGVGESTVPRLLWSFTVAVVLLCIALVVHGAAYAAPGARLVDALKTAARHLVPLFLLSLVALLIYGLLAWWQNYSSGPAFTIASWLTLKMRRPVKPETFQFIFNLILWIVRWVLLPWILVPLAGGFARDGWKGLRKETWIRSLLYWLAVPVLLVAALWLPMKLLVWVPQFKAFGLQVVSLGFRGVIAYLLFVAGLLALAWATSGPRFRKPLAEAEPQI